MSWQTEFPEFSRDMPAIPDDWHDVSWHNDVSPSFMVNGLLIWTDRADPAKRELPSGRYIVQRCENTDDRFEGENETLLETESFVDVLLLLEASK